MNRREALQRVIPFQRECSRVPPVHGSGRCFRNQRFFRDIDTRPCRKA